MKKLFIIIFSLIIIFSCGTKNKTQEAKKEMNPFFKNFNTPFETPDFSKIKEEHYLPAFKKGIEEHVKEIEEIVNSKQSPTFENTLVMLDESGQLLKKVEGVFYNLLEADTNEELQKIAKEVAPMLTEHYDNIFLNENLFVRVKDVFENRDKLNLNVEQKTLLEKIYKEFVRRGANLNAEQKERLKEINKKLSLLTLKFGENVLKEVNNYALVIDNEKDLEGLPKDVVNQASITAEKKGFKGKWVFTINRSSITPFLQYAKNRKLREKIFRAYIMKGDNNNEFDNKKIINEIVNLRLEKANLLGYKTHAHYVLDDNMAKLPENVYRLLNKIWKPALKRAKQELKELQAIADRMGDKIKIKPWDWWYYAEILKKEKYAIDDNILRPYFSLENVRKGIFMVANKLYGITFTERKDIPVYHKDVRAFEVKDKKGNHIGIYYVDYYPRDSKRGGAWMNAYRKQYVLKGKKIAPIICNVTNVTKPTKEKPALLSLDEVLTLFHEFGHALHGLMSNCTYYTLSGTEVSRDFVELPSQIMENWATEPEVLKMYAKHYKTGETIPDDLIKKIQNSSHFNQGFATVEYLAASYLDMDWHTIEKKQDFDVNMFEEESMKKIGLIPEIVTRYRSTYFNHIFSSGYSAGYYSYIWADVLVADAFEAFKETSIFDKKTAESFLNNILSRGGTEDPMVLYKRFRGREPRIEPLLKKRGLLK